jgi:hypothetical protein
MSSLEHCITSNTDISGIGVRTAAYAQNILSFVPAVLALLDGKISPGELDSLAEQSTTILLSAYALLIAGLILARNQLDNYHTTIVLNLSWMNNTNTFIYILFLWHRDPKLWSKFRWPPPPVEEPKPLTSKSPISAKVYLSIYHWSPTLASLIDSVKPVILIGSLHLSLMGVLGLWLWIDPGRFGASNSCSLDSTISMFGRAIPLSSQVLRVISLTVYVLVLVPGFNLLLPTAIFCAPLYLVRCLPATDIGKCNSRRPVRLIQVDADPKRAAQTGVPMTNGKCNSYHLAQPTQLITDPNSVREQRATHAGLLFLMLVNVLFVVDTELSISRNESLQDREDGRWTFGQTLAVIPLGRFKLGPSQRTAGLNRPRFKLPIPITTCTYTTANTLIFRFKPRLNPV